LNGSTELASNEPRDHHYVPQFFLRNFAVDEAKTRVTTVGKHGSMAIWSERSIESLGYERDFYVHMHRGIPVSVETDINRRIETPISQSDTWAKITSGRTETLDQSDRAILYALIRHLEARTPHYEATINELARIAAGPSPEIPFTDEESSIYTAIHAHPNLAKTKLNRMAATIAWTESSFKGALMMVLRSPIVLRTSTTPVLAIPAPPHLAMALPLPGMIPYQLVLTLNPTTIACLVLGDFDGAFSNQAIDIKTATGFNRHFVGQFAKFEYVRHLITPVDNIVTDMTWAPYDLIKSSSRKIVFRRRA
jgi:hypothetical protein